MDASYSPAHHPVHTGICRLGKGLIVCLLAACSSTPKSEVVVSVKDQKLGLYEAGELKKQFTISTSKFGLGDKPGSNRTPLGKHEIIAKIGHGLPAGAVLKSRSWNGEVLKPNAPGRDPIVSRILWLRGMESSNRNAMNRYIYIHGTPEESRLGQPASYGCIRMGMKDVVEVFNELSIGAKVVITKSGLPHGHKTAKPTPEAETTIAEKKSEIKPTTEPSVPDEIPVSAEKTKTATAKTATAKTATAKTATAKTATAKTATAKTATAKTATDETATDETSTGKTSTGKTSTGKTSTGKTSTGKTTAAKTTAAKTSTDKAATGKTTTAKTSADKTSADKAATAETQKDATEEAPRPTVKSKPKSGSKSGSKPVVKSKSKKTAAMQETIMTRNGHRVSVVSTHG
jgi:hypothetical protein